MAPLTAALFALTVPVTFIPRLSLTVILVVSLILTVMGTCCGAKLEPRLDTFSNKLPAGPSIKRFPFLSVYSVESVPSICMEALLIGLLLLSVTVISIRPVSLFKTMVCKSTAPERLSLPLITDFAKEVSAIFGLDVKPNPAGEMLLPWTTDCL